MQKQVHLEQSSRGVVGESRDRIETPDKKNYRWIYTYDYPSDSVWEPWRTKEGVPAWVGTEAKRVAGRLKPGLPAWLLLTDSHFAYNGTWEDTVASMRALSERVPLSGIIHLGDLTDGLLPAARTREIEARCIADMESIGGPLHLVPGNHDYNYFHGNPELRYPDRPQHYADVEGQKLRLVFFDSFDPMASPRYGFSEYCIHYLEAVLADTPKDAAVLLFSHVPPLVQLQAWTDNIRNRSELMRVLNCYGGRILAYVHGHNHCDLLFNDLYRGNFPVISINCAKCEYFTSHKPKGAVVPYRTLGDRTQESFDVMQVDAAKREIFFTRFGAGRDRRVAGGKAIWEGAETI